MIPLDDMTNIIYDTLFENTQYEQFDTNLVTGLFRDYGNDDNYSEDDIPTQEVDPRKGIIRFGYDGSEFEVTVRKIG